MGIVVLCEGTVLLVFWEAVPSVRAEAFGRKGDLENEDRQENRQLNITGRDFKGDIGAERYKL